MVHALKRGLRLVDFNEMSVGMIVDYINRHDGVNDTNEKYEVSRLAGQVEFNNF